MQGISSNTPFLPHTPVIATKREPNIPLARSLIACIFTSKASKVKKIIKYARSLSLEESEIRQACIDKGDYFSNRTLTDLFNYTLTNAGNARPHFIKRIIHEMFEVEEVMNTARLWGILKQWDLLNNDNADTAALIFDVADSITDCDRKAHLYLFILHHQLNKKIDPVHTVDKIKAIYFQSSFQMQMTISRTFIHGFAIETENAQWGWTSGLQVLMVQPKLNVGDLSLLLARQKIPFISNEQSQTLLMLFSKPLNLTHRDSNFSKYFDETLQHYQHILYFVVFDHSLIPEHHSMDLFEAFSKQLDNQIMNLKKQNLVVHRPITQDIFDYVCRIDKKQAETCYYILKKHLFDLKAALHDPERLFDPLRFRGFPSEAELQNAQRRHLNNEFSEAKDTRFNYEHSFESFDRQRRKRKPRFNVKDAEFKVASSLLKAKLLERNVFNLAIATAHQLYRRCAPEVGKSAIRYKVIKCFLRFISVLNFDDTIKDLIPKFDLSLPCDKSIFELILNRMSESSDLVHNSRRIELHVRTLIAIWNSLSERTDQPLSIVPLLKHAASLQTCALNKAFGFYLPILEIEPSDEIYCELASCIKEDEVDIPFAFRLCTVLLKKNELTSEEINMILDKLREVSHENNEFESFVNFLKNLVAYCKRNPIDTVCFQEPILHLLEHPFHDHSTDSRFNPNQLQFIGVLPSDFTLTTVLDVLFKNLPEDRKDQIKRKAESVIFRMAYMNPFISKIDTYTLSEIKGYRHLFKQIYDKLNAELFCDSEIKEYWEFFEKKVNEWPDTLIQIPDNRFNRNQPPIQKIL
jgi:CRISPR/Cas system CSM-associated protein Csm2 small subunit